MALISLGEYLNRIVHVIFRKKIKKDGRTVDGLWATIGKILSDARDEIVKGAAMMHGVASTGAYLQAHGKDKGRMAQGVTESEVQFRNRVAAAFDFWRSVGTKDMLIEHVGRVGGSVDINPHPTRPFRCLVTILALPSDGVRFFGDLFRYKPAHKIFEYDLGPGVAYTGVDYEYDQAGTGVDSRLQLDRVIAI